MDRFEIEYASFDDDAGEWTREQYATTEQLAERDDAAAALARAVLAILVD